MGDTGKDNIYHIYPNNGPLLQIIIIEDGGVSVCGVSVGTGTWFCVLL